MGLNRRYHALSKYVTQSTCFKPSKMDNIVTHSFSIPRSAILITSLFALLSVAPRLATSQSFQQPTPEELSMASDPKAPGADAVYLYREETADDPHHFHSVYARIKILTE